MQNANGVGARIKRFRELAGLSKSELARRVGVSPTAVNNWEENGVVPRMEVILKLEKTLEVNWMELMGARTDVARQSESVHPASAQSQPEVSRGDRLDQFRRQIAALFEVAPDQIDIAIRT